MSEEDVEAGVEHIREVLVLSLAEMGLLSRLRFYLAVAVLWLGVKLLPAKVKARVPVKT